MSYPEIERLPIGTLIKESCGDGFEVTWKIIRCAGNGVYTLDPYIVPFLETINRWECGYVRMYDLLTSGNDRGNTFTIVNEEHFEKDLFKI